MTEKRFYCKKDGIGQWCVSDRLNQYPMPITSLEFCSVVANALNGLWSQTQRFEKHNQRLGKENEQFKNLARDYNIPFDKLCETFESCLDENEQLKKELHKLKVVNEMLSMDFSNSEHELLRENEQLKKELKRCKNWINSDKNDYELTLAFIKNKGYSLKDVLEYEKELQE